MRHRWRLGGGEREVSGRDGKKDVNLEMETSRPLVGYHTVCNSWNRAEAWAGNQELNPSLAFSNWHSFMCSMMFWSVCIYIHTVEQLLQTPVLLLLFLWWKHNIYSLSIFQECKNIDLKSLILVWKQYIHVETTTSFDKLSRSELAHIQQVYIKW